VYIRLDVDADFSGSVYTMLHLYLLYLHLLHPHLFGCRCRLQYGSAYRRLHLHLLHLHLFRCKCRLYHGSVCETWCKSLTHRAMIEPLIIGLFCGKYPIKIYHPFLNPTLEQNQVMEDIVRAVSLRGWRRPVGCLIAWVMFRKLATNYKALEWKMTY